MSDVPDLAALRRERVASDAEYIEQLEQFSLGQERENARLRERIDTYEGDLEGWEHTENLIRDSSLGTAAAESLRNRTPHGLGKALVLGSQYLVRAEAAEAERDQLQAVVDHLRESAESAIGQDRDDEYDEGNRDAWLYVRNVLDGRAGPANALDGRPPMNDDEQFAAHYGPGELINAAEVAAILAKRDRLRAVVVGTDPPLDGSAEVTDG